MHQQLDTSVTRRRIVKTGVKLAYAAPIVAASFTLTAGQLGAISPPACRGGTCLTAELCETASGLCVCFAVPGTAVGFCHRCQLCINAPDCDRSNPVCPAGSVCSDVNCCGVAKCLQPCSGTLSDCVEPPSGAEARVYDVAALAADVPVQDCNQTVCGYF
jgi:hypothetical protein